MAEQMTFALPQENALGREDFLVSSCNEIALQSIENTANWPLGKLCLVGAVSAGKTHLTHIWAKAQNARIVEAADLADPANITPSDQPTAIENIDRIAGQSEAETQLFHLHNNLASNDLPLLITGRLPPARLAFGLADLKSRMEATHIVEIGPMDDDLVTGLLVKQFADRQISPKPELIRYAVPRLRREFAAISDFVAQVDRRAYVEKKPIGLALARDILDRSL